MAMLAPAVAGVPAGAVSMGNALTGIGTGLTIMGLLASDGNGGTVIIPLGDGSGAGLQPGFAMPIPEAPKKKRRKSKKQSAYAKAFKRLAPKYKKKNGQWKKDGFKRCVRAAHRAARGR